MYQIAIMNREWNEIEILDISDDTVNTRTLSESLGISIITIKRNLAAMQSVGVIKRVESDKSSHWETINQ